MRSQLLEEQAREVAASLAAVARSPGQRGGAGGRFEDDRGVLWLAESGDSKGSEFV